MKKILSMLLIAILAIGLFAGCGNEEASKPAEEKQADEKPAENKEDKLEGIVTVVGSTSVSPVAQSLAEAFQSVETGVEVNVQSVGSTAGVKSANEGSADVGMASRNLKTAEKEWGLTEHVIAYDGIAVVVHPSNKVEGLTSEQVTKIFKGEIKNWKEVGGEDKKILVVSREAGSGTRGAFEGIMKLEEKNAEGKKVSTVVKEALIGDGNGAVKANVASKEYSIGYVSLSYLDESIKGLKVDDVEPTVENIKSEEYPVFRPFLMLTKGEPSPQTKAYIDFILSAEGQNIVGEKLITVN